jgi:hypothetical protein
MTRFVLSVGLTALLASTPALAAPPTTGNPSSGRAPVPVPTTPALLEAEARLRAAFGPDIAVTWAPGTEATTPTPRHLRHLSAPSTGDTPTARAAHFLTTHAHLLGIAHLLANPSDTQPLPRGMGHAVRFTLSTPEHLEVQDMSLVVRVDKDGRVRSFTSDALPLSLPDTTPTVTPEAALSRVRETFAIASAGTPTLVVLPLGPHHARLSWRVQVAVIPLQAHFTVWLDAQSGEILREAKAGFDQLMHRLPRR